MSIEKIVILYRILTGRFSDVDIDNLIISKLDEFIFHSLGVYLDYKAYQLYELLSSILSLNDYVKWLRGEEIDINSITVYVIVVIAWMVSQ